MLAFFIKIVVYVNNVTYFWCIIKTDIMTELDFLKETERIKTEINIFSTDTKLKFGVHQNFKGIDQGNSVFFNLDVDELKLLRDFLNQLEILK